MFRSILDESRARAQHQPSDNFCSEPMSKFPVRRNMTGNFCSRPDAPAPYTSQMSRRIRIGTWRSEGAPAPVESRIWAIPQRPRRFCFDPQIANSFAGSRLLVALSVPANFALANGVSPAKSRQLSAQGRAAEHCTLSGAINPSLRLPKDGLSGTMHLDQAAN